MMKLYDAIIEETMECARKEGARKLHAALSWPDNGSAELVMLRDAAFELGGSGKRSANFTCVTSSDEIKENEVILCGTDLPKIRKDVSFSRIAILRVGDIGEEEKAYDAIRAMEFAKYHVFPKGYMVRVSSQSFEERVRVSKEALSKGIDFSRIGASYLQKYLEVPGVIKARIIFFADCDETIEALAKKAGKVDAITKTLTHILDGLPTDCGHCTLKPVCDEVEGMRELHMGKKK